MGEERDWTRSQFEACLDCGADPSDVADHELGTTILREIAVWGRLMAGADPAAVRVRPHADVWSALEYACHVRDLLPVMTARIARMIVEDDPVLGWWDHEAAVVEDRYDEQVPVLVIEAMTAAGREFAATLADLGAGDWERTAQRRPGEEFTVRGMARFVLHEVIHHRDDAARSLKGGSP